MSKALFHTICDGKCLEDCVISLNDMQLFDSICVIKVEFAITNVT
jgi:hypothetical protein